MKPIIELQIKKLVLHGFAPDDRYGIGDAVERELARLLAERGAPPSLAQDAGMARVDAGDIEVAPSSKPQIIGAQVARALHRGLAR